MPSYSTLFLRFLTLFLLLFSFSENSYSEKITLNNNVLSTKKLTLSIERIGGNNINLHHFNSTMLITKEKWNHQYFLNPEPWSAINSNSVCSLHIEFEISTSELENKIGFHLPFQNTSDILLKLGNNKVVNIRRHKLYYYSDNAWIESKYMHDHKIAQKDVRVLISIPIVNSELETIIKSNSNSIKKIRVLFDNDENYIDWDLDENNEIFNELNKIARIDYRERIKELKRIQILKDF
ncbi:MAG: hypothetical protein ACERIH_00160 [Labilibaculum antarcticum]